MPMTMQRDDRGGSPHVVILALAGELDASNYEHLIDEVAAIYRDGARGLVLDMTGLSFMASSGLVALYSAVRIMSGEEPPDPELGWAAFHDMGQEHSSAANVRLVGVQPSVQRVLARTGLDRLFPTDPSVDVAVAALRGA
jgi:anti-anti-sigma regulatory factor